MPPPHILLLVAGMGDPAEGSTSEWGRILFPGSVLESSGSRRWFRLADGSQVFLVEALYEDVNELANKKFDPIWSLLPDAAPDTIKQVFREYFGDVATNVLVGDLLDASRERFVRRYTDAIQIAIDESFPEDFRLARLGVLCHSLGTFVTFEGLHAIYESDLVPQYLPANVVMCAPMLRPIYAVQKPVVDAGMVPPTFLTRNHCRRPHRTTAIGVDETFVRRTLLIHNKSDPFYMIHRRGFYRKTPERDFVDEFLTFDSHAGIRFWEGHSMANAYLQTHAVRVRDALFG